LRRFAKPPNAAISESNTLFTTKESAVQFLTGSGANTGEIPTFRIFILVSQLWVIMTQVGLISTMRGRTMKKDLAKAAESWAKAFLAAALATYLAVGWDVNAIANAALASVLPSVINWLNPNYERYGKVK
jgi:hypothetical protein